MRIGVKELRSRIQSGKEIYRMAKLFPDLGTLLDTTLLHFYNYVRDIPYKEDPELAEIVARPKYLLDEEKFPALDCKKKAVLIGAWLNAHNTPWRLIAISERPDKKVHHVFNQAFINNKWLPIDATYPEYHLFAPKPNITYGEKLPR